MLFSIIMCTYNSAKSLKYAVDSVRNQVFDEWELIILDNGSEDETVSLLKVYEKTDNRIKCKYFEKILMVCRYQFVFRLCTREYMMFLGQMIVFQLVTVWKKWQWKLKRNVRILCGRDVLLLIL